MVNGICIIDGYYLFKAANQTQSRETRGRIEYRTFMDRVDKHARDNGVNLVSAHYFTAVNQDASPDERKKTDAFHTYLRRAKPDGPHLEVHDRYFLRPRKTICNHCRKETNFVQQRGVDSAIISFMYNVGIRDLGKYIYLVAGDSDFTDTISDVNNLFRIKTIVVGTNATVSSQLQSCCEQFYQIDRMLLEVIKPYETKHVGQERSKVSHEPFIEEVADRHHTDSRLNLEDDILTVRQNQYSPASCREHKPRNGTKAELRR